LGPNWEVDAHLATVFVGLPVFPSARLLLY